MKPKKSAKDLAFEKERGKYQKKIREMEKEIASLRYTLSQKECEITILNSQLMQKEDWVRRLLEYTELNEEDMKKIIDKEKNLASSVDKLKELSTVLAKFI